MKLKLKLSVLMIAIMIAVVAGISYTILRQASNTSLDLSLKSTENLLGMRTVYWGGVLDAQLQIFHTVAGIMADYESIPAGERRDRFDQMLLSTLKSHSDMTLTFTSWKPDAIDGNDARYIGRPGSSPTGQYVMTYSRESGQIVARSSADIQATMAHLTGPNARKVRIDDPMPRKVDGRDTYVIIMMVPIVNSRTGEVVGGVGGLFDIAMIQPTVEQTISVASPSLVP